MDHPSHSLLCRSPLRPRESLPSLLIRLARENFYHSPAMVAQLCRERLTRRDQVMRPTQTETFQILAELVQIEVDELHAASVQRFAPAINPPTYEQRSITLPSGKTVPVLTVFFSRVQIWPESNVQFCPLCLQESAHHRVDWLPLAVSVCLHHQCLLVRGCPKCQEQLKIQDVLETQCHNCDFELTQTPVISVAADQFGLSSQSVIQSWLGLSPPTSVNSEASLPGEPPATLYRLLDGLRRAVMCVRHSWDYLYGAPSGVGVPLFPCTSKRDMTPAKSYILYATAFRGMVDWPRGFYDFLDAYKRRDGQAPCGHVHRDLGCIYTVWLEKLWRHPAFRFVQQAFDRYLSDEYSSTSALVCLRRLQNDHA